MRCHGGGCDCSERRACALLNIDVVCVLGNSAKIMPKTMQIIEGMNVGVQKCIARTAQSLLIAIFGSPAEIGILFGIPYCDK